MERGGKRMIQNPGPIVAGIHTFDAQGSGGLEAEIAQAEQGVRSIQMAEDRAIRLFASGKITEAQLDIQRKFITERPEIARAKLDDCRAREASGAEKRRLMETVLSQARNVGQGIDELADQERQEILQMVAEQVVIDRDSNVDITLAVPIDDGRREPLIPLNPTPPSPSPLQLRLKNLRIDARTGPVARSSGPWEEGSTGATIQLLSPQTRKQIPPRKTSPSHTPKVTLDQSSKGKSTRAKKSRIAATHSFGFSS